MSRRLLIVLAVALPALALIVWLVLAQLPRWTAPQPGWFAADTPGVCAAVESLKLYQAVRAEPGGIGSEAAKTDAAKVVVDHYDASALAVSDATAFQATLPGSPQRAVYVVTVRLTDSAPEKDAVIYLDVATGDPLALITAVDDPALNCNFDVRAALVAAAKSPPVLLLIAYFVIVAGALVARGLFNAKGRLR